jgi:Intracellular proteinase inhibitor
MDTKEGFDTTRIGVAVLSTKLKVATGDPIGFYVAIANLSVTDLVVNFPPGLQFDFALRDKDGKEYWRYSTSTPPPTPTPMLTPNPGATSITVKGSATGGFNVDGITLDQIPLPKPLGDYVTLVGELPSSNLPFVGTLRIATTG